MVDFVVLLYYHILMSINWNKDIKEGLSDFILLFFWVIPALLYLIVELCHLCVFSDAVSPVICVNSSLLPIGKFLGNFLFLISFFGWIYWPIVMYSYYLSMTPKVKMFHTYYEDRAHSIKINAGMIVWILSSLIILLFLILVIVSGILSIFK